MTEQQPQEFDLAQELRELGEQLKRAIQVARDHPQTKEFERQVTQAVNDLGAEIDRALKSAREDKRVKKAETHVKEAVQSIQEGGAKEDIERGLAKGVRALNEQIRKAIEEAEKASREQKT
jgi:ABC-type branched-subunit amino acid transport system substrate-binding protein